MKDYTQALKLDPKIPLAYFRRALIDVRRNNPDGAIADTTQSLDLDPKNTQAYYYRGFAKFARGNLDGATSDLRLFCEAAPHDRFADNARLYLWVIAKLGNQHGDADQDLSDALENGWNTSADDFTSKTAAFLLGRATESDYLTAASSTDGNVDATQHCQAFYFAGMKRLLMGDKGNRRRLFPEMRRHPARRTTASTSLRRCKCSRPPRRARMPRRSVLAAADASPDATASSAPKSP